MSRLKLAQQFWPSSDVTVKFTRQLKTLIFADKTILSISYFRLAEEKKEEGNQLYKVKHYRDALTKYSEAIGEI